MYSHHFLYYFLSRVDMLMFSQNYSNFQKNLIITFSLQTPNWAAQDTSLY